jgi:Enoyl-(Acyl carrier protein) reductase
MVLTPFNQQAVDDPEVRGQQVQSILWKRAAEPWEIGRLAVYLASDDADYVTGPRGHGLVERAGGARRRHLLGEGPPWRSAGPIAWRAGEPEPRPPKRRLRSNGRWRDGARAQVELRRPRRQPWGNTGQPS